MAALLIFFYFVVSALVYGAVEDWDVLDRCATLSNSMCDGAFLSSRYSNGLTQSGGITRAHSKQPLKHTLTHNLTHTFPPPQRVLCGGDVHDGRLR